MSLHRRSFAFAALAALGLTAGLGAAQASVSAEPARDCNLHANGYSTLMACNVPFKGAGSRDMGRRPPVMRDIDPGYSHPQAPGGPRWRGSWWRVPHNPGPFPPYAGNPAWPRRSGPLGPPF